MCRLPARSIPGSEMPFVEKTRTRADSATTISPASSRITYLGVQRGGRAASGDHADERVARQVRPVPHVLLGLGVAGQEFYYFAHANAAHCPLGFEHGGRARAGPRPHGLVLCPAPAA